MDRDRMSSDQVHLLLAPTQFIERAGCAFRRYEYATYVRN
jgi:hypothetical protein